MKHEIKKNSFAILISVFALIITFSMFEKLIAQEYEIIEDKYGKPLAAIWKKDLKEVSGELAILKRSRHLVVISCQNNKILKDEKYIFRADRNCNNDFTSWFLIKNLPDFIVAATGQYVVLTGPPTSCGACMPKPFDDFELHRRIGIDHTVHPEKFDPRIIEEFNQIHKDDEVRPFINSDPNFDFRGRSESINRVR